MEYHLPFQKGTLNKKKTPSKNAVVLLIGLATGFISGLTGAVGLIFNRFYLTNGSSKQEIVATPAANEVILHIIKLILYASFGLLITKTLTYGGLIALAAIISSLGIKYILPLISEAFFQKIGYGAMVLSGGFLFSGAIHKISASNDLTMSFSPISGGLETSIQWKKNDFKLEFEYDEGFEIEQEITLDELPGRLVPRVLLLSNKSDNYMLEKVSGFRKHSYELYVWKERKLIKYDLQ